MFIEGIDVFLGNWHKKLNHFLDVLTTVSTQISTEVIFVTLENFYEPWH